VIPAVTLFLIVVFLTNTVPLAALIPFCPLPPAFASAKQWIVFINFIPSLRDGASKLQPLIRALKGWAKLVPTLRVENHARR